MDGDNGKKKQEKTEEIKQKRKKIAEQIILNDSNLSICIDDLNKEFFTTILPFIIAKSKYNNKKFVHTDFNRMDNLMLFSKYKPSNSKHSTELTADEDSIDFISTTKSSHIQTQYTINKPNYTYETNSILMEIDDKF